jgi:hypothetical protein
MTRLLIVIALTLLLLAGAGFAYVSTGGEQEQTALKRWTGCPPYC